MVEPYGSYFKKLLLLVSLVVLIQYGVVLLCLFLIVVGGCCFGIIYYRKSVFKTPNLKGQVAIVTGASRGIGKGIAIALGEAGAVVYITGRSKTSVSKYGTSLEKTAEMIEQAGGVAKMIECDHFDDGQIENMIREVMDNEGKIDILVNNVFYVPDGRWTGKFWEQKMGYWDPTFACGVRCHYLASCFAAEHMVAANSGLIVNISSLGSKEYMYNVAYGSGKAAVDKMSIDMGKDLKNYNITSIGLHPGLVKTEFIMEKKESYKRIWGVDFNVLGEDPIYTGRAIASIASDNNKKRIWSGTIQHVADLAAFYGFRDIDGSFPPATKSIRFIIIYAYQLTLRKLGLTK